MKRIFSSLIAIRILLFCVSSPLLAEEIDYEDLLEKSFEGSASIADLTEADSISDPSLVEGIRIQLSSEYKVESLQTTLLDEVNLLVAESNFRSIPDLQKLQTIVSTFVPSDSVGPFNLTSPTKTESRAFSRAEKFFAKAAKMRKKNRLDRVLIYLERGEARATETLKEHWLLIPVYRRSGSIALEMGELSRAGESYGKALNQSANLLGNGHPQTISIASKLAKIYERGGNYDRAINLRNIISETMESIFGPTHFLTLKEYERLSFAYRSFGDIESALGILGYVCGVYDSVIANFHPNVSEMPIDFSNFLRRTR